MSNPLPSIRELSLNDIPKLMDLRLRDSDVDELKAAHGWDNPNASLMASIIVSSWVNVLESEDGEIVAVFGFKPESETVAVPWMLATDKLAQYSKIVVKYGKEVVKNMLQLYPVLYNFVDKRNVTSIKWLKSLGFEFDTEDTYFVDKSVPFIQFFKTRGD